MNQKSSTIYGPLTWLLKSGNKLILRAKIAQFLGVDIQPMCMETIWSSLEESEMLSVKWMIYMFTPLKNHAGQQFKNQFLLLKILLRSQLDLDLVKLEDQEAK